MTATRPQAAPVDLDRRPPALLVSYVFFDDFVKRRASYHFRDYMLDSGAYTVYKSGGVIDLDRYVDFCLALRQDDPQLCEIVSLDIIGDGPASRANVERMRRRGVEAMPVFHLGEDWGIFSEYCAGWDKVGLGCAWNRSLPARRRFFDRAFALSWPKKLHSFGWVDRDMLLACPFHSADTSSWQLGPCGFGDWRSYGRLSWRGGKQNLRAEVEWYLRLERDLQRRWRAEMARLEGGEVPDGAILPSVRLAITKGGQGQINGALGPRAGLNVAPFVMGG